MKVLITVGIFPPDIGGPASFVPKIANILTENGYEVIVVCLSDEKIEDELNYKVVRIIRRQNLIIRWIKTIYTIIRNSFGAKYIFVNGLPMESYVANLFLRKKIIRKIVGDWAWERGRNDRRPRGGLAVRRPGAARPGGRAGRAKPAPRNARA